MQVELSCLDPFVVPVPRRPWVSFVPDGIHPDGDFVELIEQLNLGVELKGYISNISEAYPLPYEYSASLDMCGKERQGFIFLNN